MRFWELSRSGSQFAWTTAAMARGSTPLCDAIDGPEIGRWMTSFGRRVGHWLTDITPLAPLLSGQHSNFTIYTAYYLLPIYTLTTYSKSTQHTYP